MLMLAATAGLAAALPVTFGFAADQIITGHIFKCPVLFTSFVLSLIHARADASIAGNRAVDYTLIRNVYIVFCILTYGFFSFCRNIPHRSFWFLFFSEWFRHSSRHLP